MEKKRILVIDDERDLCDILLFNLHAAGFQAQAVYSAEEALQLEVTDFDLLLLDVMMPGMSGFELAEKLKASEKTAHLPIIFLTAKDTEDDTLRGFGLGADDYVPKPFSVREVMARVKAVLSRVGNTESSDSSQLIYDGLVVDGEKKVVMIDGENTTFTRTEFELLNLLMKHRGQVFSRRQLLDQVWPQDVVVTERTVDVNIARLRKKLGRYAACLISRTGFGYSFEEVLDKK